MSTNVQTSLLDGLREVRKKEGLNDLHFAHKLGISPELWYMTLRGDRKPGIALLRAVVRIYPKLIPDVIYFLSGDVRYLTKPRSIPTTPSQTPQNHHRTIYSWLRYQYLLLKRKLRRTSFKKETSRGDK